MKKVFAILLAIIMAFSCVVVACAEDEAEWDEIMMSGFQRGDVNADGKISAVDALLVLKFVVNTQKLTGNQEWRADVTKDWEKNGDGNPVVTAADARLILQAAAGNKTID